MNPTRLSNLLILIAAGWALPLQAYDPLNRTEYLAKIKEAEAVYKEKCEKVAGIRIYKTVPDVEGVLLMKVRPARSDRELADPNWPGAAFGREARGDEYIASFLGVSVACERKTEAYPQREGILELTNAPATSPGYRWVEVIDPKVGQRYRYAGRWEEPWLKDKSYLKGYIKFYLDKVPSPSPTPPRYAVTFEDHVIPEERALWIASSTVKVLDLQTNDVLGEMTRYAMSYIHAPRQSMPWLNHYICPSQNMTGDLHGTRKFVDLILIPKRGE